VNSLPKTVIRQRRDCDSNPGPSVPESSTLPTRLYRATTHLRLNKLRSFSDDRLAGCEVAAVNTSQSSRLAHSTHTLN